MLAIVYVCLASQDRLILTHIQERLGVAVEPLWNVNKFSVQLNRLENQSSIKRGSKNLNELAQGSVANLTMIMQYFQAGNQARWVELMLASEAGWGEDTLLHDTVNQVFLMNQ